MKQGGQRRFHEVNRTRPGAQRINAIQTGRESSSGHFRCRCMMCGKVKTGECLIVSARQRVDKTAETKGSFGEELKV